MIPKIIFLFYFIGISIFTILLNVISIIDYLEDFVYQESIEVKPQYEVIIVGAGVAGSTILAGIESEDVLLVEAGNNLESSRYSSIFSRFLNDIPIATPMFQQNTNFDWQHRTVKQKHSCFALNNNVSFWPMGKGFGGSQLLNNMIYHRGHKDDYSEWFTHKNNYNYSEHIWPYFIDFERQVELNELQYKTEIASAFIRSAEECGYNKHSDFFHPDVIQNSGRRWTVARTATNRNHQYVFNAQVERVILDENATGQLKATSVTFIHNGKKYIVNASRAIILAAGTIGTPTVLLKSGIGPKDFYQSNPSLQQKKDLPEVGKNLQDHVTTGLDLILLNDTIGLEPWNIYSYDSLKSYFFESKGPLTMVGCEGLGFIRSSQAPDVKNYPDLSLMLIPIGATVDAGIHFKNILNINDKTWKNYFQQLIGNTTISIMPVLLHPKSRGFVTIELDTENHWIPKIEPNYLSNVDDVNVLTEGIKIIEQLINTPSLQRFNAKINTNKMPGCEMHSFGTESYWNCYVRHLTLTAYHPVGTCRMGQHEGESVIDHKTFQVHSIEKLFICDASVMPSLPSGNPQAVVGMLATKFLESINKILN